MQRSRFDIWIGLFIALGAASLVVLALKAANLLSLNWEKHYHISAVFDDVGGLKPGAAVKSAGILVGRVEGITLDQEDYQAIADISLQQGYSFPEDSKLKIMTSGLLGEMFLSISAGVEDKKWQPGTEVTNTQSAVMLEDIISQFIYAKSSGE